MSPDTIDAMLEAGLTREQMAAIFKAELARQDTKAVAKRERDAERKRNERARKAPPPGPVRDVTRTSCDMPDIQGQSVTSADSARPHTYAEPEPTNTTNPTTSEANASSVEPQPAAMPAEAEEPHPIAKPKPPDKRGSRLPKDWWPASETFEWCLTQGLSDDRIAEIVAEFRDYWCPIPGSRGLKLDWEATFRNQVRRHFGGFGKPRSAQAGRYGSQGGGRTAAHQRAAARFPAPDDVPRVWPDLLTDGSRVVALRRTG